MKGTMAVVGACALLLAAGASAETLRFATEGAYPPFNYVDADTNCTASTSTSPMPCASR